MTRIARSLWRVGGSLVALSVGSAALAQTAAPVTASPADAAAPTVGEIIVTANKRKESLMTVPESVTAVSGAQLESKGIYNVQDLVKVTPGLSYVESGRSVPVFSLRGVGFFDTSIAARPTVSVYVDEVPISFSTEVKGAAFDLERVEVLKGPQGTLFGQNATGGAINYIAAKPTDHLAAGLTASYGRFNTADVQGYVSGPLSSTLDARIALRTVQSGDWQKSYTRDDSLGAQRFGQGRLILDWHPIEGLKVALTASGWIDKSDTQAPQFEAFLPGVAKYASSVPLLASYPVAPANDRAADWDPGTPYRNNSYFYQTDLRVDYEVSKALTITSITAYDYAHIRQLVDADGTDLQNLDSSEPGQLKSLSEELRASGTVGRVSYIAGLMYAADNTDQSQQILLSYSTTALAINPATPGDNATGILMQHFKTYAAFSNIDYALADTVTLHAGVRFTQANLEYADCTVAGNASTQAAFIALANATLKALGKPPLGAVALGQCVSLSPQENTDIYNSTLNQNNVSWRGGIDFKPTPNTLLYANVSKGFKGGSASTPTGTNDLGYSPATQESVVAYEAGIKTTLLQRKLELTGAAFYYDYRNKQVLGRQVFTPNIFGPVNALSNIPKSEIDGGEAQVSIFPVRGLTLTAAGTYLHSKVLGSFVNTDILGNSENFQGDAFPFTPKWQLVFDGDYRFPLHGDLYGSLGGNASYRSATTSGFGGNSLLDIDAYWLVDLRAGVDFHDGKYRVQIYGRNVTNTYYWTDTARAVDNVRRYAGMPATYGIQFSARY